MPSSPPADRPVRSPRAAPRISPLAVVATLVLVAGAIAFGILGPRMGQRGMRIRGIPTTTLRDAILEDVLGPGVGGGGPGVGLGSGEARDGRGPLETALQDLATAFGPAVEPPRLEEEGLELADSRPVRILGVDGVRLEYVDGDSGRVVVLLELNDPLAFVHFDDFGRQQPILPGIRIGEEIDLGWSPRASALKLGLVMLGFEGRVTIIVALDPELVDRVADVLDPPPDRDADSVLEGVATILEKAIGPMSRS